MQVVWRLVGSSDNAKYSRPALYIVEAKNVAPKFETLSLVYLGGALDVVHRRVVQLLVHIFGPAGEGKQPGKCNVSRNGWAWWMWWMWWW